MMRPNYHRWLPVCGTVTCVCAHYLATTSVTGVWLFVFSFQFCDLFQNTTCIAKQSERPLDSCSRQCRRRETTAIVILLGKLAENRFRFSARIFVMLPFVALRNLDVLYLVYINNVSSPTSIVVLLSYFITSLVLY